ncbi:MAG TPA: phosphatase [Actinobacteria bacterium]|nr:phosphatase [Actinomycetota bacterium]
MAIDLHIHSTASDGTLDPEEIIRLAAKLGLSAIAITDHDSVEGVGPALKEGERLGIEVIPAVELSSDLQGRDIHFLGYFIDFKQEWFRKHLEKLRQARYERAVKMVQRLREAGLEIALRDVLKEAGEGAVGRAHIARVLVKQGLIDGIEEVFSRYIGRHAPCYVEKYIYTPEDIIAIVRKAGGIAILAHPGYSLVDEQISEFIRYGLQGLEAYYHTHTPKQTKRYERLAERHGLMVTGGSDCHGLKSSRGLLIGSVNVPDRVIQDLKRLKEGV